MMFNIEQFLDLTGYEQSRLDRRKNNKEEQELIEKYSEKIWNRLNENLFIFM